MGVVDTAMVGRVGQNELAAVAVGHIFSFSAIVVGMGALRGLDPYFSQGHGGGQRDVVSAALLRAIQIAFILSVPLTALHLLAGPILSQLGQPPEVVPIAADYCRSIAPGVLPLLLFLAITQFLQGLGFMRRPMVVILVANLLNFALDAVFVLNLGGFDLPISGAVGCGWATTGVRLAMFAALLALSSSTLRPYWARRGAARLSWRKVVPDASAAAVQASFEVWAFGVLALLVGTLGAAELAGHGIAINVASLAYMIPSGISAAAATRIGHLAGAGNRWVGAGVIAIVAGAAVMLLSSVLLFVFPVQMSELYTPEAATIAVAASLLPIAAIFQVFDGIQAVALGVLRGAGDLTVPALTHVVGFWFVGLPIAWHWGTQITHDPRYVWGGAAIALFLVAALLCLRLVQVARRGARRVG